MPTEPLRFEVDGIEYDQAIHDRMDTGGNTYIHPSLVPKIPDDECLCGTGFVCLEHSGNRHTPGPLEVTRVDPDCGS
jgi:hypothetical protein